MILKLLIIVILGLFCFLSVQCNPAKTTELTCDNIKCGRNQECAPCGQNMCNTYTCFNRNASKFLCLFKCPKLNPTCICKPYVLPSCRSKQYIQSMCTIKVSEDNYSSSKNNHNNCSTNNNDSNNCSSKNYNDKFTSELQNFSTSETPTTGLTCDNIKCGENQECAGCGQNACNTYSCLNPDGSKIKCLYKCPKLNPTCVCKPNYYRVDKYSPCMPLSCPKPTTTPAPMQSTTTTPKPPSTTASPQLTCDNVKCPKNEECAHCGQNACNTYSCSNPNGSLFVCLFVCPQLNPTCICKPYFHRPDPKGPCVPLSCSNQTTEAPNTTPAPTTGYTCDKLKCGNNEECAPCGKNACNTYDCSNQDGTKRFCSFLCRENNAECICKTNYYRPSPSSPCVPLSCKPILP